MVQTELAASTTQVQARKSFCKRLLLNMKVNWQLYLFVLPAVVSVFIFSYMPMYGIQMAFQNFRPMQGFAHSEWVGLDNFIRFIESYQFKDLITNTLGLSLYSLLVGFPIPIVFALVLNQLRHKRFKALTQSITYVPHFISTVVVVGMLLIFLSPSTGLIGHIANFFGMDAPNLMAESAWFKTIYVLSDVWQHTGWDTIIFLAALSAVDPQLYDAASVDGANRFQRMWNIDLPSIIPAVVIVLILRTGSVMNIGFEKAYLMQNNLNLSASEIISTYEYKLGILSSQYSFSAAIGLFNSVINFILLMIVNYVAKRANQTSLW